MSVMSSEHPQLTELGHKWIAAWNSRNLEHVLTLYADDAEMTSDHVVRLGFSVQGSLRGKHNLRAYWSKAFAANTDLHFNEIALYTSPNSLVVHYENQRGQKICEYLRVDRDGRIVQGSANHL
jgi:ketosteroid isomerase-like protein